jgi:jouberin
MQRYIGALSWRDQIRSVITPCGSFVFAGSEDNQVFVWNTESADRVAVYKNLNFRNPVCGIDFHPHDNMAVFSSFGDDQVVLLYKFDMKGLLVACYLNILHLLRKLS